MINLLSNWQGSISINGQMFNNIQDALKFDFKTLSDDIDIKLLSNKHNALNESNLSENHVHKNESEIEYRITVKPYMTKEATPEFDFMRQWNNNIPMPMRTMIGTVEKETRGMVYMKLHGFGEATVTCMCCGKELTNPISRHYGVGPICLSKIGITNEIEDVSGIKSKLQNLTWSGWIIKSAIIDKEEE